MTRKKKKVKKRTIVFLVLILILVGWTGLTIKAYEDNINQRFESYPPLMLHVEDFEGLERTRYTFSSDQGQELIGYLYRSEQTPHDRSEQTPHDRSEQTPHDRSEQTPHDRSEQTPHDQSGQDPHDESGQGSHDRSEQTTHDRSGQEPRGLVVMAHGFGGGGHNSYMDVANYFAQHGYAVFAYDATGNDESEGEGVGGIPQGVVDLDYALTFLEKDDRFSDLPIFLFGHSWGAYSVCSVLTRHPEVKAVIACSGCNRSSDIFEVGAKEELGKLAYAMTPIIRLHERIKYGNYANLTAMDGFEASQAAVMIVHSLDDPAVSPSYGYDQYYEKYKEDPRFSFKLFKDRGHNVINDPQNGYKEAFNKEFDQWLKTRDYDYKAKDQKERFAADKAAYINAHLDRKEWASRLDQGLMQEFVDFYDRYAGTY